MKMLKLFVLLSYIAISFAAKLPSSFTQCSKSASNFDECLTKSVENAITQLTKAFPEVALPTLGPLEIPSLVIGAGTGPVDLSQNYEDVKVTGFTNIKCSEVQATLPPWYINNYINSMDFEKKNFHLKCFLVEIRMDFTYKIKGKILLLPVYGTGPGYIKMENVTYSLNFDLEEFEKKGQKHFKVVDSKLKMEPGLIRFNFENLFDGDKALGDNINNVINDNWKELFEDVGKSYEEAYGKIFGAIFNNLLSKVPVSAMFSD